MIRIFGSTDKTFTTLGDAIIKPLRAKVRKEDNGDFYLDLQIGNEDADLLVEGNLIVAPTPQGDQAFRIRNVTKTQSKTTLRAKHVFYDSGDLMIADVTVTDLSCNAALLALNGGTDIASPFSVISDIATRGSYHCVRKSLYEAVQDVLAQWGGHLVRDNFSFGVRSSIGADNGVTVRYRKNLRGITCEQNWDDVVTKLLPVGKDGILLNAIDQSADIYVYSTTQYNSSYTKTINFTQNIEQSSYPSEAAYKQALVDDLRAQAQAYVNAHSTPTVNYTLSANVEKVTDVGDVIHVSDARLGIDLLTNVIAYEYDCILGRYTSLEFGNFQKKLSGLVNNITSAVTKGVDEQVQSVATTLGQELEQVTDEIWATLSDSYVIYEGDKILVLDAIPKENARNVIMISSGGIGFSSTGISGTFNSAWSIDGTLNMQAINVINFTADLIRAGILQDALGKNVWNLGTGRLSITDGSIVATHVRVFNHADYSQTDLDTLDDYMSGVITSLTDAQKDKYDIDGDGLIDDDDYSRIDWMITNASDIERTVATTIDPKEQNRAIQIATSVPAVGGIAARTVNSYYSGATVKASTVICDRVVFTGDTHATMIASEWDEEISIGQPSIRPWGHTEDTVDVPNDAWATVGDVDLPPGMWYITAVARFTQNATGRRMVCISTDNSSAQGGSPGNPVEPGLMASVAACSGARTSAMCAGPIYLPQETHLYMNCYQNSGGKKSTIVSLRVVRMV